jgi:hypothetical protein
VGFFYRNWFLQNACARYEDSDNEEDEDDDSDSSGKVQAVFRHSL